MPNIGRVLSKLSLNERCQVRVCVCALCAGGAAGSCAEHWAHAEQAVAELAVPGVCVCACVCVCVCACVVVRA